MSDLHVIYTESGDEYGWSIESPQIPELVGGRDTITELLADTASILDFAGASESAFDRVVTHEQHAVVDPDGDEYLLRWQISDSDTYAQRYETATHLNAAILDGHYDSAQKAMQPQLATTERLLIAVVPADTLGWAEDQLTDGGCAVLNQHQGDGAIYAIPFGKLGLGGVPKFDSDDLGLTRESTFAEMLDAVLSGELAARMAGQSVDGPGDVIAIVEHDSRPIPRLAPA